jgi:hypothetical protein
MRFFSGGNRKGMTLALVFGAFSLLPLGAQDFMDRLDWSFGGSVLLIPEDNGLESDPMPILASPGVAAAYPLLALFDVEATLDFYGTNYGYSETLERAVPFAIENRSSFVVGTVLGIQGLAHFPLPGDLRLRVYAGPAFDLRLCLTAGGLEGADLEDAAKETGLIADYFWGSGRWILPVVGAGIDYPASEKFLLGLDARLWMPLYRAWSGEDLPAVEGWRLAAGLRVSIR